MAKGRCGPQRLQRRHHRLMSSACGCETGERLPWVRPGLPPAQCGFSRSAMNLIMEYQWPRRSEIWAWLCPIPASRPGGSSDHLRVLTLLICDMDGNPEPHCPPQGTSLGTTETWTHRGLVT